MLASRSSLKFCSYITGNIVLAESRIILTIVVLGWLTVIGWQAVFASTSYITGIAIQGLVIFTHSDYSPQSWHGVLLCIAVIFVSILINLIGTNTLPNFEGLILILHILGFFAILIPLTYLANHRTASEVFTTFVNGGNWPTQGLSIFVGLIGNVFTFLGPDAAVHVW